MTHVPENVDLARLVIVTAVDGTRFIGHIPTVCYHDRLNYMERKCIKLCDVRMLVTKVQMMNAAGSSSSAVSSIAFIVPIDVASSPLPSLHIRPASWYFPCEFAETKEKTLQLLDLCINNEKENKAREAGIVFPREGNA
jgi:hypothetical protein